MSAERVLPRTRPSPRRRLAVVLALLAVACALAVWCLRGDGPQVRGDVSNEPGGYGAATPAEVADATTSGPRTDAAIVEPAASAAALLTGTFLHADGTAVDGVEILLVDERGNERGTKVARGSFEFERVVEGQHWLVADVPNELRCEETVVVVPPRTHVDLRLRAKRALTIKAVTPDGKALHDAIQHATPEAARWPASKALVAAAFTAPLGHDLPPSREVQASAGLGMFRAARSAAWPFEDVPADVVGRLTVPVGVPLCGVAAAQCAACPRASGRRGGRGHVHASSRRRVREVGKRATAAAR